MNGNNFVLAGRFSTSSAKLGQEIEAAGGRVTLGVSSRTDYLVEGKSASAYKLEDARALGVAIITEEDVRAMMRGEDLAIAQPGEDGSKNLDDLIGAARGVFDGMMGVRAWEQLVGLLDACDLEQEDALAHYISSQILARWEAPGARERAIEFWAREAAKERWTDWLDREHLPGPAHEEIHGWAITQYDRFYSAPAHWLGEMMRGVDAPKYGLARTIDLTLVYAAAKKLRAILTHPNLENIRNLRLSGVNVLTKQNAEVVMTQDCFSAIRTFSIGGLSASAARELAGHEPRPELHTLDLRGTMHPSLDADALLGPLLDSPVFDHVTCLLLGGHEVPYLLEKLVGSARLPSLERMVYFTTYTHEPRSARLVQALFERVSELRVDACYPNPIIDLEHWSRFCASRIPASIRTLDISAMMFTHAQVTEQYIRSSSMLFAPDDTVQNALSPLCQSTLLEHIERLRLGPLIYDERITSIFAEQRPDIELIA